mmetsp:Transcript_16932/g.52938  ORF Transcript_16932/g.52938 Transcript_16932/m.52938 type:complete len:470 (+) Transcript_16932:265-1674(+)
MQNSNCFPSSPMRFTTLGGQCPCLPAVAPLPHRSVDLSLRPSVVHCSRMTQTLPGSSFQTATCGLWTCGTLRRCRCRRTDSCTPSTPTPTLAHNLPCTPCATLPPTVRRGDNCCQVLVTSPCVRLFCLNGRRVRRHTANDGTLHPRQSHRSGSMTSISLPPVLLRSVRPILTRGKCSLALECRCAIASTEPVGPRPTRASPPLWPAASTHTCCAQATPTTTGPACAPSSPSSYVEPHATMRVPLLPCWNLSTSMLLHFARFSRRGRQHEMSCDVWEEMVYTVPTCGPYAFVVVVVVFFFFFCFCCFFCCGCFCCSCSVHRERGNSACAALRVDEDVDDAVDEVDSADRAPLSSCEFAAICTFANDEELRKERIDALRLAESCRALACSTTAMSDDVTGLDKKPFMVASLQRSLSSCIELAVMAHTKRSGNFAWGLTCRNCVSNSRMARVASNPSMIGISQSMRTMAMQS